MGGCCPAIGDSDGELLGMEVGAWMMFRSVAFWLYLLRGLLREFVGYKSWKRRHIFVESLLRDLLA